MLFRSSTGDFDHEAFWEYVRELSKRCTVLVSEETAPNDFACVWSKQIARQVDVRQGRVYKTEKLFSKTT